MVLGRVLLDMRSNAKVQPTYCHDDPSAEGAGNTLKLVAYCLCAVRGYAGQVDIAIQIPAGRRGRLASCHGRGDLSVHRLV